MKLNFTHVATFVLVAAPFGVLSADAQPGGGTVVSGSAAISNPSANSTIINQTTGSAIINWQNFSLASGASVQFNQPNAAAITLNRVLGGGTSEIYGSLQANGQVWIINSNGILFGKGAQINVSGLLATTSDIADSDFAAGRYNFNTPSSNSSASVDNAGTIHVANGGSAILSGSHVVNSGLIQADAGNIVLGGANAFTVDFDGDNLLRYQITSPISNSPADASGASLPETVTNSGTLAASGGSILMTSRAAANVADNVINNSGIILARSAEVRNGQVILDAGDGTVSAGGTIDASGTGAGQTGGTIALAGSTVRVADGTHIDVSGDQGGGTVDIGGDLHGAGPLQNADNTSVGDATIDANAISAGNGGTLVVWSNGLTDFSGIFSATGGLTGGNGGFAETSGHTLNVAATASVDTLAPNGAVGTWLLDPTTVNIETGGGVLLTGATVAPSAITGALASSNVTITATSSTPSSATINVINDISNYTSGYTLSLLSEGSIYVGANIQNKGSGAIYVIAGWDGTSGWNGTTLTPANFTNAGAYGNHSGVVYVNSDYERDRDASEVAEGEAHSVSIGSASGTTTIAGSSVQLEAWYGSAQIGYSGATGGPIIVDATGAVTLTGTSATPQIPALTAQIGNGTVFGSNAAGGNVTITANSLSTTTNSAITGQTVTVQPYASSTTMGLGTGAGSLALTQSILNEITATTLVFGNTADTGAITIGGSVSVPSTVTNLHLVTGGNITMNASSSISDGNANAQLVLAAGGAFINNSGSGALVAGGTSGRWLVYSNTPGGDTFNGLNSGNSAIWNSTYATLPPASVSQAGNRYLFAYQPTLTVTTTNVIKTYGSDASASVAAAYTLSGLQAGVANAYLGDSIGSAPSVTSAGSPATASVSPGSPYAITATTGSLAVPNGYATSFHNTGTLTVNPAPLTITANAQSTTYGTALPLGTTAFTTSGTLYNGNTVTAVTLLSNSVATVPGSIAAGTYSTSPNDIVPSAAAGTNGFVASNYSITYLPGTLTIDRAALLITANNDSKTYGTLKAFSGTAFTASGLVTANGDTITSVSESSIGSPVSASVGGYAITASGAVGSGLSNYTISYAPGTLTVNPAALLITANNDSKTYGTLKAFAGTAFTASGLVTANGDTITSVSESSTGSPVSASVGGYGIVASNALGTGLSNYTISYAPGTLTVNPAALLITANNDSKTYGTLKAFAGTAFTASGLVTANGDTITSVSESSTGSPVSASVGGYAITASGAVGTGLSNYTISYNTGTLTVNPAPLTITANNDSKTYGTLKAFAGTAFTASGLVTANGDSITSVSESSTGAPVSASVGSYGIVASNATGAGLGNYTISYSTGTLTVNPAPLTITANDRNKTYGTNLALGTTGFTTGTLYNGDAVTGVTLASAGATASATVAGGPYAITPSAATGTGLSNYNISYATGLLTVSPAVLSYVADAIGIPFGSAIPALTGAVTGFVNGETLASATSGTPVFSTAATSSSSPGSYAVTGSGLTALHGNYTFTQSPSNATALTISAVSAPPPPPDVSGFTSSQLGLQGDRPTDLDSVTALLDHSDSTSVDTVFVTQHEVTSLTISVDSAAQSGPIATLTVDGNGYIEPPTSADQLSTSLSQYYGNGSSFDGSYPGWGNQALWY